MPFAQALDRFLTLCLDLQHELFLITTEYKLALAPLPKDMHHALDVGTGTGIWAIDFGKALDPSFQTHLSDLQLTRCSTGKPRLPGAAAP